MTPTVETSAEGLRSLVRAASLEASEAIRRYAEDDQAQQAVADAGALIAHCLQQGGKVLTCGNGGSMCDAMHLAEELSGRFRSDRRALAALALSDPSYLTCVGNDMGFEEVFARGVEALGRPGDVLVAFSTSGTSPNVLRAAVARANDLHVVVLTGHPHRPIEHDATIAIVTPGGRWADRVQEVHGVVMHTLIELVEQLLELGARP